MTPKDSRQIETLAVHAGQGVDPATRAVTAPIYLSTTFERDRDGDYPVGYSYSRHNNPNRAALETCLAALEGASEAVAFSSGLAVANAVLQSLKPGDHPLPPTTFTTDSGVAGEVFANWQLAVTYVDMSDPAAVAAAIRQETALIWVESHSNPLLKITDLAAISALATARNIPTVCDSTFASPVLQQPLEFGIDMVAHSTTKFLSGHSDVTGGVLLTREPNAVFTSARVSQNVGGAVPSPFDCWLTLRGIATLPLRVRPVGIGDEDRGVPGRASERRTGALPRVEEPPRTRNRCSPDERLWRHAFLPGERQRAGGDARGCGGRNLHARDQPRRRSQPD
jgi:cystathionine gamma-synthase